MIEAKRARESEVTNIIHCKLKYALSVDHEEVVQFGMLLAPRFQLCLLRFVKNKICKTIAHDNENSIVLGDPKSELQIL